MQFSSLGKIILAAQLFAGVLGITPAQATPTTFTGSYVTNFDALGTGTAMPAGFQTMIIAGANSTYSAATPISAAGIASATVSGTQTLTVWTPPAAVASSSTALFNCGTPGNTADRALGTDPTGVAAMVIELSLTNKIGSNLPGVTFSYDLKCLTNGSAGTEAGELPGYAFFYSTSGGATAVEWTRVDALSPGNFTQGTVSNSGNVTISFAAPLANNGVMYFRWADDNNAANSPDQMLAIDNIVIGLYVNHAPDAPVLVSPVANATGVTNHAVLDVMVSDPDTNILAVTFYGRVAGAGNFTVVGTVTGVPSGGHARKTWFGLTTNTTYEWYAAVSDGQFAATNSIAQFTTASSFSVIPPTVSLTSPANNAAFSAPASIPLAVTAADADGVVTNVAYYNGATKLADVATSPFSYGWAGVAAGSYALKAIVTDDQGLMATSSVANVTVTNSPAVQILQQARTIFVIAMENHNFKQPNPLSSPQQIFTNPAAPYINSLITPGHSNAVQVSYATKYYNAGVGVHPSEPSYIWAEGGTDFGFHMDNDPSAALGNIFTNDHLARQLNVAGLAWKSYQEDVQFSASPTNSASGTSGTTINPYYGTGQYNYAVKHNPSAFYTDTQTQNVFALTNFLKDLTNNAVGRYNWITPNLYNDQHNGLSAGFTYHGIYYINDQAGIAQGDNFLAILIPKIMASAAYKDHGVIILWWDETEGGDNTSYTIPEIILSPMAKGNAYASSVEMNHSSDVKTLEEIFGLPFLTNPIPAGETKASGSGYNDVATVNDLSDLFRGIPGINVSQSGATLTNGGSAMTFGAVSVGVSVTNTFTVTNSGLATLTLSNIVATGANAADFTVSAIALPASVVVGGGTTFKVFFAPGASGARSATLQVTNNDAVHNPFTLALNGVGIVAPTIVGAQMMPGSGGFQLTFSGPTSQTYQVLASDDLTEPQSTWAVVDTGTFGSTNAVYTDTDPTHPAGRFYLIKSP